VAYIHRIGEPENESETKAIRELGRLLPENYHVIHDFELAADTGLPYEYDIAVLGEHAVYHVEVKGYRGLIRGDLAWSNLGDIAWMAVVAAIFYALALFSMRRRLVK